jgi:hypothetical protein
MASIDHDLAGLDVAMHARLCQQFFGRVSESNGLSTIYSGASEMLAQLLASGSMATPLKTICVDCPDSSNSTASKVEERAYVPILAATSLIQDLVLVTSYLCSSIKEASQEAMKNHKRDHSGATVHNTSTALAILVSLGPYWNIATLITQLKKGKDEEDKRETLQQILVAMMRSVATLKASCDISDECLHHLLITEANPTLPRDCLLKRLVNRLRNALKSHLRSPLFFATVLAQSLRYDLMTKLYGLSVAKGQHFPVDVLEKIITETDNNSIDVIRCILRHAPRIALRPDLMLQQATPIIYCTSHSIVPHIMRFVDDFISSELKSNLTLGMVQAIAEFVPSALTLADKQGLYPLHHAARKGLSPVVVFLCKRYPFTVPLTDGSGKYPLHHMLLSWQLHRVEDIIALAEACPMVLTNSQQQHAAVFKPLPYARTISESLYEKLLEVLNRFQQSILQMQRQVNKAEEDDDSISCDLCDGDNRVHIGMAAGGMLHSRSNSPYSARSVCSEQEDIAASSLLMLHNSSARYEDDDEKSSSSSNKRQRVSSCIEQVVVGI